MTATPVFPSRFESGRSMIVAGFAGRISSDDLGGLPRLWQRFAPRIGHVPKQIGMETYGLCYHPDERGGFEYLAGVEVADAGELPKEFTTLVLAPQRYAVFEHRDGLQALKDTFDGIFQHWLPNSGEHSANSPVFERYPATFNPADPRSLVEIWVPLEQP
ncbi:GyrI-like domain-containing protein [Pseudomonas capeferrum]|uniref:GyrI-like domain-containing protein n=1 Tax=Pseudomonas capeferrum TaxID=1495066 RepID=UPI0015E29266|nr:GyrI-like domain-containing protein [Pseudomonas capeferrum]MBA1200749.1 GyrI-like domain-containing protein [Pseudomonas capeferrum]